MLSYVRLSAAGNDFLLLDGRLGLPKAPEDLARELCPRRLALGADGLLVVDRGEPWRVRHYEPNGEQTFCLNGVRGAAAWLVAAGHSHTGRELLIQCEDMDMEVHVDCSEMVLEVAVSLPRPLRLEQRSVTLPEGVVVHGVSVDVGNPQFVVLLGDAAQLDDPNLMRRARSLRWNQASFPEGTNVNFVALDDLAQPKAEDEWLIRTYERGVEDETLSCGSGILAAACALASVPSLVLAGPNGPETSAAVSLPFRTWGGDLQRVTFPQGAESTRVWASGPVRLLCSGDLWGRP